MTTLWTDLRRRLGVVAGALLALGLPGAAGAADCDKLDHDGQGYAVCTVTADEEPRLGLWLYDGRGRPLNHFGSLRKHLGGQTLLFAMNAGMYHSDYAPVGLFRSGEEVHGAVVTGEGGGNFGLLPNGVFCTGGKTPFQVIESRRFSTSAPVGFPSVQIAAASSVQSVAIVLQRDCTRSAIDPGKRWTAGVSLKAATNFSGSSSAMRRASSVPVRF